MRKLRFEQIDDTTWVDSTYGWTIVPYERGPKDDREGMHEHWKYAVVAPDTDDKVAAAKTVEQAQAIATRLQELKAVE